MKTLRQVSVFVLFSVLAFGASAPLALATSADVANLTDLQTALASTTVDVINIKAGISAIPATLVVPVGHAVTINGGGFTLTFTGLESVSGGVDDGLLIQATTTINNLIVDAGLATTTWVGTYAVQVYNTTATLNNITAKNGNGGILINNSTVNLTGNINVSSNGFGGIESSGASAVLDVAGVSLWTNTSEAYGLPTIWEDGVTGTTVINYGAFTRITKGGQYQYYLIAGNSVEPAPIPATAPILGTAGDFAALGTAVALTTSVVTGDVGSTVAGVAQTRGSVTGTTYPGAAQAVIDAYADFQSAYNAVTSMSGTVLDAGTLAAVTLTPGVYSFDPTAKTGVLTLNAQGDANAVWILKGTGALTATDFSVVFLSGVGSVSNVFWWTPATTGATLTRANLKGTILSGAAITVTGVAANPGTHVLNGRALATAGVTITNNTISATVPLSSTKDITSFSFPEGTGVITGTNIAVIVPSGTNLTSLTPTIVITGASVSPLGGVARNFSNPVTYIVTADNASTKTYTVTVGTYYNDIIKTADRLVALQNANGSWDWDVTNQTGPTALTYYSVTGVTAQALLDAYALNNDQTYLDRAMRAGDFIVGTATSTSQGQNAFNVVFLQDLATASASSTYGVKANDILNNIFSEDNKWAHTSGSNCTVTGCTADQLVAAYANYRSSNRGLVPWDVAPFVIAEVRAGNTALAQALVNAIVADTANYTSTAVNYDLGLAGKVIAAKAVNDTNLSTYVAELVSRQNIDGSFGLAGDGQVQTTSYALKALVAAGGNVNERDLAARYIGLKFGYSGFDGWKDTDNSEYAETDSEAAHALFSVLPASIPYATFTDAVTQSGTSGSVAVTVEIPSGTAVTGDSSWDGVLDPPTATTATVAVSGFNTTVTSAIDVGSSDSDLTFDKAVRLVFTGQAGTHVGWYNHAGMFTEITADCLTTGGDVEASQTTTLGAGASCKMDVGSDLVIWTKHFSTFVTYTQTAIPAPAPISSGGGGIVGSDFNFWNTKKPRLQTIYPDGRVVFLDAPAVTITPAVGEVLGEATFRFNKGLGVGSRGDDVTELQNRLTAEGVYSGPITGYFGSLTTQGVKNFQKKYGISQVGVVGPQTRSKLNLGVAVGTGTGNVIPGCALGNKFNTNTGLSCSVQAPSGQGCAVGNKFNTNTGQACPVQ